MKLAVFGDNGIGRYFAQLFDTVSDVTFYISESNKSGLDVTSQAKYVLSNRTQAKLVLKQPIRSWQRYQANGFDKKLDFHYFEIEAAISKNSFDVALVTAERSLYTLASLKRTYNFKLVYWIPFTIPFVDMFNPRSLHIRQQSFEHVDQFIAITQTCAGVLSMEGIDPAKIRQVYPGVDTDVFRPRDRSDINWSFLGRDSYNILYVGKLTSWKGCYTLLYAARLLRNSIPNLHVTLVGKGAQVENLRLACRLMGLEEMVTFLGFIEYSKLPQIYNEADVFVLPSLPTPNLAEQFGFVVAEAMASGLPTIVSRVGGLPEVVNYHPELLFVPGDYRELAERILQIYKSPEVGKALARKCIDRAQQSFDSKLNGRKLELLLSELVAS